MGSYAKESPTGSVRFMDGRPERPRKGGINLYLWFSAGGVRSTPYLAQRFPSLLGETKSIVKNKDLAPLTRTGSSNYTEGATTKNNENYIIIKDKDIAETFEEQFQKLWEKHK